MNQSLMSLTAGTQLGPYEIVAPLGKGGMGEVYRARDTRLRREVAIKVSAEQFSERFEREARAIASLNHPNICQLYDVGPNYLVMELIEGPTLADRIAQSGVPVQVRRLVARCLVKDPKNRLRDITGMELLLEETVNNRSLAVTASPFPPTAARKP